VQLKITIETDFPNHFNLHGAENIQIISII